ncbi:hypothetical protein [Actinomadura livida]|uniref:Prenyltransferase n=1 Tax=Actinomadura livida TaxID=79909 RepID=A0A7W7MYY6_9ACTN|nr:MULTISPECIES: hypothetical protein [Actinomadura]MBB4776288.1 hypothetical protein [Actinomadura catellatispora]GGU32220.1 hypothetical protein GCM10010208_66000 [Actinomadura livida]
MNVLDDSDLARAADFMRRNGRLIDRHRFALHFRGGPPGPVLQALRAYENPDGGYGHALEPDLRGEGSQPVPAQHALEFLHEAGADDDPAVARIADYLASIARADGGVPFVLPTVRGTPHAPWWQAPDDPPGSINPTATLAGLLHRAGSDHPWLGPATAFCWRYLEAPGTGLGAYDVLAILTFLDHVPDRDRAEAAFTRLRGALGAHAHSDHHGPLDFAPDPGGYGRRLFTADVVDRELDALIGARHDDGGWDVDFPIWTPVTRPEWRGFTTVEKLRTLRAYGRLKP